MSKPSWFIALDAPVRFSSPPPPKKLRLLHSLDHHLTVSFFGHVEEALAMNAFFEIERQLRSKFSVIVQKCAWFGGHAPRAIAFDVQNEGLKAWIGMQRPALLSTAACAPDTRAIRPHITFARLKHRASQEERLRANEWMRQVEVESTQITLTRIALYTWRDPYVEGKPRYKRVNEALLK